MKNAVLLGIAFVILISSCKETEPTPEPQPVIDYTPLAIGNYWIFENVSIDTVGTETDLNQIDSIIVDRDTVINGNTYSVLVGTNYPFIQEWGIVNILRDSGDYLVNNEGVVLFSDKNFTDILAERTEIHNSDTLFTLEYQMEESTGILVMPAGTFNDPLNYKGTVLTNDPAPGVSNPRYINNYYVPNVGKAFENYFYLSSSNTLEKRLLRYEILIAIP